MDDDLSKISIRALDNGLAFYACKAQAPVNTFSVCLSVRAGAAYEGDGEHGLSHFLEHLSLYPHLYGSSYLQNLYFNAFNYAYTSFYETAYLFKAVDYAQGLLKNSLLTAKGILEGTFLSESALIQTRKDILTEYCDFLAKPWQKAYINLLNRLSMTLPAGWEKDILRADYEKLTQIHRKRYKPENAAIIVVSAYDADTVYSMLDKIFRLESDLYFNYQKTKPANSELAMLTSKKRTEVNSYSYIACCQREKTSAKKTLKNYMLFAVSARAIEISLTEKEEIMSTECAAAVFGNDKYIFSLKLLKNNDILFRDNYQKFDYKLCFSIGLFEKARAAAIRQIDELIKYSLAGGLSSGDIIDCCIEHFLYGEPIISIENNAAICYDFLNRLEYGEAKILFESLVSQFAQNSC
ncbi:MAG: insulinase family protein [Spirochaetaceae bacterium]|nr:insulinase family protein [Spirochaetaceae bacterium]